MHPIVWYLIRHPEAIARHLYGYAELVDECSGRALGSAGRRLAAWAVCALAGLLFLMLGGVALMLGGAGLSQHWSLWAVPGVTLLVALGSFFYARQLPSVDAFAPVREQLNEDVQTLRDVGDRT